jgi:hypothetical protein
MLPTATGLNRSTPFILSPTSRTLSADNGALPALYYFMLKTYVVTSLAAFIDRYGYPIRIGKYGKKATEKDITTLKRAVAATGQDFGAVIPESALLEIIESKHAGETSNVYKNMADWADFKTGQTMTTDEGSNRANCAPIGPITALTSLILPKDGGMPVFRPTAEAVDVIPVSLTRRGLPNTKRKAYARPPPPTSRAEPHAWNGCTPTAELRSCYHERDALSKIAHA